MKAFDDLLLKLMPKKAMRRGKREERFLDFVKWFLKLDPSNRATGSELVTEARKFVDSLKSAHFIPDTISPMGRYIRNAFTWEEWFNTWWKQNLKQVRSEHGAEGGKKNKKKPLTGLKSEA